MNNTITNTVSEEEASAAQRKLERLCLPVIRYNSARIFERMSKLVIAAGGAIVTKYQWGAERVPMEITARDKTAPAIISHFSSYISFVLDDMYYYYQVPDNPFFEDSFLYSKIPVRDMVYEGEYYASAPAVLNAWATRENNAYQVLTDDKVDAIASNLLETLKDLPTSQRCRSNKDKRTRLYYETLL